MLAATFSAAAHVGVVLLVVTATPAPPPPFEPPSMTVALVDLPRPPPPRLSTPPDEPPTPVKAPAEAPKVQPAKASPKPAAASRRPVVARPSAPATQEIILPVGDRRTEGEGAAANGPPGPSEGQIAGATTAESGGSGGGACNMARRLQTALRKDPDVRRVVTAAHHEAGPAIRALWVWNGDWIRSHGQDGAGLAALRETILWEVGFAPAACRAERMQGLVLITLADGPGAPRVALGGGSWRWSDLLSLRAGRGGG